MGKGGSTSVDYNAVNNSAKQTAEAQYGYNLQNFMDNLYGLNPNISSPLFSRTITMPKMVSQPVQQQQQVVQKQVTSPSYGSSTSGFGVSEQDQVRNSPQIQALMGNVNQPVARQQQQITKNALTGGSAITQPSVAFSFGGDIDSGIGVLKQNIGQALATPYKNSQTVEDEYYTNLTQDIENQKQIQLNQLQSRLASQGIVPGSDAYERQIKAFNDSINTTMVNARNAAMENALNYRAQEQQLQAQPLSLYGQLLGYQAPYLNLNSNVVAPADYTSAYNNALSTAQAQAQANAQRKSSTLGTIGSLAGTIGGALLAPATGGLSLAIPAVGGQALGSSLSGYNVGGSLGGGTSGLSNIDLSGFYRRG